MNIPTDTEMIDWLNSKGGNWIARDSTRGRGYRIHQTSADPERFGAEPMDDIRLAIADAMKREEVSVLNE